MLTILCAILPPLPLTTKWHNKAMTWQHILQRGHFASIYCSVDTTPFFISVHFKITFLEGHFFVEIIPRRDRGRGGHLFQLKVKSLGWEDCGVHPATCWPIVNTWIWLWSRWVQDQAGESDISPKIVGRTFCCLGNLPLTLSNCPHRKKRKKNQKAQNQKDKKNPANKITRKCDKKWEQLARIRRRAWSCAAVSGG